MDEFVSVHRRSHLYRHAPLAPKIYSVLIAALLLAALPATAGTLRTKGLVPAACGATTATFSQSTPVAIPTGPGVVTSTLVVSGAGVGTFPFLDHLQVKTFLRHSFAADLDVTLASPAGTVVTLTTDNGADNDDVFDSTVWDDDADPAGQVPYGSNDGLVTDHAYVNGVLASPLAPEEPLGAFRGENPNGTWTITISDDKAGDGGSLDGWSLTLTSFPASPTVTGGPSAFASPKLAIPSSPGVVTSTVVVAGAGSRIQGVDVRTNIQHPSPADLDITVTSPSGTVVTLTTDNGGDNDDVFLGTTWDDDADPGGQVPYATNDGLVTDHAYADLAPVASLTPEEALSAFAGEDPNGTWTLTISTDTAGAGGTLDSWGIDLETYVCNFTDLQIAKSDGVTSAAPGSTTTYTIVATNAGPGDADPVELTDAVPFDCASLTYTSTAAGGASGNTASGSGDIHDEALHMPAGSSVTYLATCIINDEALGFLQNVADIRCDAVTEVSPADNGVIDNDLLGTFADLTLTKTTTTPQPVAQGDNVVFALAVGNAGPEPATGVVVTDALPAGLAYVSNDCGASFAAGTLTWNVGNLAAKGSATCNLTTTVTQTGTIVNTASAAGNEDDATPADNAASAAVTAQGAIGEVPTLGPLGLFALTILLGGSAVVALRRKRQV